MKPVTLSPSAIDPQLLNATFPDRTKFLGVTPEQVAWLEQLPIEERLEIADREFVVLLPSLRRLA
jgi:hypothetical protein